ncbi:unnamed protein product, partial [Cyprideis torosa]
LCILPQAKQTKMLSGFEGLWSLDQSIISPFQLVTSYFISDINRQDPDVNRERDDDDEIGYEMIEVEVEIVPEGEGNAVHTDQPVHVQRTLPVLQGLSQENTEENDPRGDIRIRRLGEAIPLEFNPADLPEMTTHLVDPFTNSHVFLVGTSHFSIESQNDVGQVISTVQPDAVMVELCKGRSSLLEMDEETILEEAKNINMNKIMHTISQSGVVQGLMHILLLNMSAHITKQLGMAPGGEFRRAMREASLIPHCRIFMGDRPVNVTLSRAIASLSPWQKIKLAWHFIASYRPIRVVGVVGLGHVNGIVQEWGKKRTPHDIYDILSIPKPTLANRVFSLSLRLAFRGAVLYLFYRLLRRPVLAVTRSIRSR